MPLPHYFKIYKLRPEMALKIKNLNFSLPELLGECWLPREFERACGGPGGLAPFLGLPGGRVSVMDIKLAIGLCNGAIDGVGGVDSPIETGGNGIGVE
jgi:hypothetical protein